jgi:hypothetical protein
LRNGSTSTLGLREAARFAKDQRARLRIIHIVDEAVMSQYPEAVDIRGRMLETFMNDGKRP